MKIAITISIIVVILTVVFLVWYKNKQKQVKQNIGAPIYDNPGNTGQIPIGIAYGGVPRICNPGYKKIQVNCIKAPCPETYIDDIGPCVIF